MRMNSIDRHVCETMLYKCTQRVNLQDQKLYEAKIS